MPRLGSRLRCPCYRKAHSPGAFQSRFSRSRGATPRQVAKATETYATSYVDVRRRQIEADTAAAVDAIRRKIVDVESQLESAEEPQRAPLVGLMWLFKQQVDTLEADLYGPRVVGSTPAQPVDDGTHGALVGAALGATVGVGADVSQGRPAYLCAKRGCREGTVTSGRPVTGVRVR